MARRLEQEGMTWIAPLASLVRAATANAEGDAAGASAALREAIERATGAEMCVHVWWARRQLGCVVGGDERVPLVGEGNDVASREGGRDGLGLDRSGGDVVFLRERAQDRLGEAEFIEGVQNMHFP